MTKKEVLNIVIKIFGLYYFVKVVQHFMDFLIIIIGNSAFDYQLDTWFLYGGIFLSMVVELTFAYVATLRTELITNIITKDNGGTVKLATNKTDLLEITLSAIGILAIVFSISDILYPIIESNYFHDHKESDFWSKPIRSEIFRAILKILVGIFLLMNSRNFAKMIVKRGKQDDKHDEERER
jgi:hypothetical protein